MVVKQCECTKNHWIVPFKYVTLMTQKYASINLKKSQRAGCEVPEGVLDTSRTHCTGPLVSVIRFGPWCPNRAPRPSDDLQWVPKAKRMLHSALLPPKTIAKIKGDSIFSLETTIYLIKIKMK